MLLGKRARPSMRRTTSMTGLTVDPINMETSSLPPLDPSINDIMALRAHHHHLQNNINKQQVSVGVSDVNIIDHGFVHHHLSRRNTVGGGDAITSNSEFELKFMSSDNVVAPPKPRLNQRRNSGDFSVETAHFLRSCGLCKRRLAPGRDIFMYRGDTAFCSLECRQQQIQHDDKKEKCSRVAKKEIPTVVPVATLAGLESSNNGETVALAAA